MKTPNWFIKKEVVEIPFQKKEVYWSVYYNNGSRVERRVSCQDEEMAKSLLESFKKRREDEKD